MHLGAADPAASLQLAADATGIRRPRASSRPGAMTLLDATAAVAAKCGMTHAGPTVSATNYGTGARNTAPRRRCCRRQTARRPTPEGGTTLTQTSMMLKECGSLSRNHVNAPIGELKEQPIQI